MTFMDYLKLALFHTMEQLLVLVVPTVLIAFVMNIVAQRNWRYGDRLIGRRAFSVLTALGTMIHEISHALACYAFRHDVKEIALFKPDSEDGSLGYVKHAYDRRSLYQRLGNLPIGIAPIFGGGLALALVIVFFGEGQALRTVLREPNMAQGPVHVLLQALDVAWDVMARRNRVLSLKTVLFVYLAFCIGTNISLSKADMQGALPAVPLALGMLFAVNVLLAWIPNYSKGVAWVVAVGAACLGLLVLVLAINAILLGTFAGLAKLLGRD
jgi:hypothetical protein